MKNPILSGAAFTLIYVLGHSALHAAPVDLSAWQDESYPAVANFNPGIWTVAGDGESVNQSVNGQPTFFYSDFNTHGSEFNANINVGGGDDDFIGFALGFNPGDASNAAANYLLIDWKRGTQTFDFGVPSNTPGSTAPAGLAVSRVTGTPTADEFWGHTNFLSDAGGGLEELERGANLGATGWATNTDYLFTFDFGPNNLNVFVDGIMELSIAGLFGNGRFGFYNFSQADVTYSGITQDPGTFPAVPVPAAVWLFGTALIGLFGFGKRRRLT